MKKTLFLAVMAFATLAMVGCKKDNNPDVPEHETKTAFDDLKFFQSFFVNVDSLGNFVSRSIGIPLPVYDKDTTHIYIGVENLEEALDYWKLCLAPDITTTTSDDNTYTYTLTDAEGTSQGTVSFTPSTESSVVADITTNLPGLRHFNKVTFIQNDSWPVNFSDGQYQVGDIRTITMSYHVRITTGQSNGALGGNMIITEVTDTTVTRDLDFVCIREKGRGVKPMYVAITPELVSPDKQEDWYLLTSDYCPAEGKAKMIAETIGKDWNFYKGRFAAADCGDLNDDGYYWYDGKVIHVIYTSWCCINLKNGEMDALDYDWHTPYKHALLKVDWLDD